MGLLPSSTIFNIDRPGSDFAREPRCRSRAARARVQFRISRRPSRLRFGVARFERLPVLGGINPDVSVAGFSLPSVVGAGAANFMPGPKRFPSADLTCVLDRDETMRQTRLPLVGRARRPGLPLRHPAEEELAARGPRDPAGGAGRAGAGRAHRAPVPAPRGQPRGAPRRRNEAAFSARRSIRPRLLQGIDGGAFPETAMGTHA